MLKRVGFILIICSILLCSNSVYASENISKPMIKSTSFQQLTGAASKLQNPSQQKLTQTTPEKKENVISNQMTTPQASAAKTAQNKVTFVDLVFRMLKGLFEVILVIAAFAGIVWLYKFLVGRFLQKGLNKNEELPTQTEKAPQTISEAVSSFVKHRIKKK